MEIPEDEWQRANPGCERPRCSVSRSEEHTSELQSLRHLVCRLLLEKKKGQSLTERDESATPRGRYRVSRARGPMDCVTQRRRPKSRATLRETPAQAYLE